MSMNEEKEMNIENTNVEDIQADTDIDTEFEPLDDEGDELSYKDKIKALRTKLQVAETERREYLDGWQRAKADAINREKQYAQDKLDITKFAARKILLEVIPVMDSFLMAMKNKEAWENVDQNWRIGVEYIKSQLDTMMKNNGLEMYGAVGDEANPERYSSLDTIETEDTAQEGKVAEVLSVGYTLHGKIIREAKVKTFIIKK